MAAPPPRFAAVGDRALLVTFGDEVDDAVTARVQAFARRLADAPLPGVRDVVPAYTTVTLHYRAEAVPGDDDDPRSAYERLCVLARAAASGLKPAARAAAREVVVPVWYGGQAGPDLPEVARRCGLPEDEVVRCHVASPHRVCMLGFAPGFPFVVGLDRRLVMPRRGTPRTEVPAGSVAIAREQTCIYPLATPGGWNLIGRTPMLLFDPDARPPSRLLPGDRLRFEPIDEARFHALQAGLAR